MIKAIPVWIHDGVESMGYGEHGAVHKRTPNMVYVVVYYNLTIVAGWSGLFIEMYTCGNRLYSTHCRAYSIITSPSGLTYYGIQQYQQQYFSIVRWHAGIFSKMLGGVHKLFLVK